MSNDIEISIEEVLELVSFYRDSEGRVYIMNKLDQLQKDVADLENLFSPAPHWSDTISKITGESDG